MTEQLHPTNPYYRHWNSHFDEQAQAFLEPYSPSPSGQQSPRRQPSPPQHHPSAPQRAASETPAPTVRNPNIVTYRTRSIGGPFSAGVVFERAIDLSPPNDDEIIIAPVRITNAFRRASLSESADLPSRPPRRSFLRRMSTRLNGSADANQWTAIKMTRRDYKRYFVRDKDGNYAGTEIPEREWTREDLDREFGDYQGMPLRSIPGGQEYGEGDGAMYRKTEDGFGWARDDQAWRRSGAQRTSVVAMAGCL